MSVIAKKLALAPMLLLALGLAAGCEKAPTTEGASPAAVPAADPNAPPAAGGTAAAPATSAAPAGAADPEACASYVKAICEAAGEGTEACNAVKTATGLMPPAACQAAMGDIEGAKTKLGDARKACNDLMEKLCKDIGEDTQTCKMVREKTPGFPTQRCTDMMGRYDNVLADLKKMEAANQPLSAEVAAKMAAGNVPSAGPADAKVTVVEFSDFECPFCSRAADALKTLKTKYADKPVRFVFRQYPLPFHQNARPAAIGSLEAHAQGKFWEFHDKLFENQKALDRASLEKYAAEIGLDVDKFKKALDETTYEEQVKSDMTLGEEVGVQGTPTLFVNSARVQNPSDADAVSAVIEAELAK